MSATTPGVAAEAASVRHMPRERLFATLHEMRPTAPHVWLSWVGYTTAGTVLGALLVTANRARGGGFVLTVLAAVLAVLLVGGAQGLVLRRYRPALTWRSWLAATIAGHVASVVAGVAMFIPGILSALRVAGSLVGPTGVAFMTAAAIGAVAGAAGGWPAWLVLRRHFSNAGVWVLATTVAGTLAALIPVPRAHGTISGMRLAPIAARIGTGLIVAIVTGVALSWLVRRRAAAGGVAPAATRTDGSVAFGRSTQ